MSVRYRLSEDWYTLWDSGIKRGHWRYALSTLACRYGLHRIRFEDNAVPAGGDPPTPPEAGWCCVWCGELRLPRRAWLWTVQDWLRHPVFMWKERA